MNAPQNTPSVSNEVLAERILNVGMQVTTLIEKVDQTLVEIAKVPVIARDVSELRVRVDAVEAENKTQSTDITEFKTSSKIVGSLVAFIATLALALGGWLYGQLSALHDADVLAATRLQSLEIKAQLAERSNHDATR